MLFAPYRFIGCFLYSEKCIVAQYRHIARHTRVARRQTFVRVHALSTHLGGMPQFDLVHKAIRSQQP